MGSCLVRNSTHEVGREQADNRDADGRVYVDALRCQNGDDSTHGCHYCLRYAFSSMCLLIVAVDTSYEEQGFSLAATGEAG